MRASHAISIIVVAGTAASWLIAARRGPIDAPVLPAHPSVPFKLSASAHLLNLMLEAARAGDDARVSSYTAALAALPDEAVPEITRRLRAAASADELILYATTLIGAGREKALPEILSLWDSPRFQAEGAALKRPLVITFSAHRTPQMGQALFDLWGRERDPEVEKLLTAALLSNPQINGKIVSDVWAEEKDPDRRQKLQGLILQFAAQVNQQEETQRLMGMDLKSPDACRALTEVLDRPGVANKGVALTLLGKLGSPEAQLALLAFAKTQGEDQGLRHQALAALCPKADYQSAAALVAWYPEASPEARFDVLNAIVQSANPAFLAFVKDLAARDADPRVRAHAKKAVDQIEIAGHRQRLDLKR